MNHDIKFTWNSSVSRSWKSIWNDLRVGRLLFYLEKDQRVTKRKHEKGNFHMVCHLSFFLLLIKNKKESQTNLGDWQNCEKAVKPIFRTFITVFVNPGKARPGILGPLGIDIVVFCSWRPKFQRLPRGCSVIPAFLFLLVLPAWHSADCTDALLLCA